MVAYQALIDQSGNRDAGCHQRSPESSDLQESSPQPGSCCFPSEPAEARQTVPTTAGRQKRGGQRRPERPTQTATARSCQTPTLIGDTRPCLYLDASTFHQPGAGLEHQHQPSPRRFCCYTGGAKDDS